jgi:hypothetical protein
MIEDSDSPPDWIARNLEIEEIVALRAATIRGIPGATQEISSLQEIALSSRPLEVEVFFDRPIRFDLAFDGIIAPIGMTGTIQKIDVTENPTVVRMVEKVTSDTDLGAMEACRLLRASEVDVYHITRLLSSGLLGRRRHLVPTRWAITATDEMLFAGMRTDLDRMPPLEEIRLFTRTLYGNTLVLLLLPGSWQFEMIETWQPGSLWGGSKAMTIVDGERKPRTTYSPIAGAYYSARLAVAEYLQQIGRTATVLLGRTISSDYWAPLGTWVVREAVRSAFREGPHLFPSLEPAVSAFSGIMGMDELRGKSRLISALQVQKSLLDFVSFEKTQE